MTLIEIVIVITIIAIASTGVTYGFRALNRTNLRSACMHILAASRFAYGRSVTRGNTVRLVLDADASTLALEEAEGMVTIVGISDKNAVSRKKDDESIEEQDSGAVDAWAAAKARLSTALEPVQFASPFGIVSGRDGTPLKKYGAQPFGSGVKIHRMILAHRPEPRTEGKEAIYFFPGCMSERAVIQLSSGETVYTVELKPMSGSGKVYAYAYDPPTLTEDTLEDPG
ncbi:MAG: hypothetical protein KC417_10225 [Myxococcales bacterium]|nr:hypothetical protein [Myxococcales bacterium]